MGRHKTIADDELLEVARRVFRERGHTASTRDVASAAGISQAVLYQRFRSKDDLFFAAMMPASPDLSEILGEPPTGDVDGAAYLRALARRLLAYFEGIAPSLLHLITHPSFRLDVIARAHDHFPARALEAGLADRLKLLQQLRALGSGDVKAAASVLVAALHSYAVFGALAGAPAASHAFRADALITVLWQGLRPDLGEETAPRSKRKR